MTRRRRGGARTGIPALVLALAACGGGFPDGGITDVEVGPRPAHAATPGDPRSEEEALTLARYRWNAAGARRYDLVVTRTCTCADTVVLRTQVRDLDVTVLGGDLATTAPGRPAAGAIPSVADVPTTVKGLLRLVAAQLRSSGRVTVTYHPDGVPLRIETGGGADGDGTTWTVVYTPLPR